MRFPLTLASSLLLPGALFPAAAATFSYSPLLSKPVTLSAFVQSYSNGTVVIQGGDTAQPNTPFTFAWGDGSTTSGFFTQQHTYLNTSQNYVLTITAHENDGSTQQTQVGVFLSPPSIARQSLPTGVVFTIPTGTVDFATHYPYPPPSGETVFPDSAFPTYTRGDMEYILTEAAAAAQDFANNNTFLWNGVFQVDMLENQSFGGGYSLWYTTPMSVGYGLASVSPTVQWHILFNELGKDTTLNSPTSLPFGGNTDGGASEIYSETMGDIFSYALGYQVVNNAATYGIGNDVVADMSSELLGGAASLQANFNTCVGEGAPFSSWNPYNGGPDPTLCTLTTLAWKFIEHAETAGNGYRTPVKRMMQLLQLFDPAMLAQYDPGDNSQSGATFRSTLMVAAESYAFGMDLRAEFRALNFPIDDTTYQQLYTNPALADACDVNGGGATVADVQLMIGEALGARQASNDLNQDGQLNVVDVQTVINDVLQLGCTTK